MAFRFFAPTTLGSRGGPVLDLHREVNRLFEDMFDVGGFAGRGTLGPRMSMPWPDVRESDK